MENYNLLYVLLHFFLFTLSLSLLLSFSLSLLLFISLSLVCFTPKRCHIIEHVLASFHFPVGVHALKIRHLAAIRIVFFLCVSAVLCCYICDRSIFIHLLFEQSSFNFVCIASGPWLGRSRIQQKRLTCCEKEKKTTSTDKTKAMYRESMIRLQDQYNEVKFKWLILQKHHKSQWHLQKPTEHLNGYMCECEGSNASEIERDWERKRVQTRNVYTKHHFKWWWFLLRQMNSY